MPTWGELHPAVKVWHSRRLGLKWYPDLYDLHPDIAQAVMYLEAKERENTNRPPSSVEQHVANTIEAARSMM